MVENLSQSFDSIVQGLVDCCDGAVGNLGSLHQQIKRVIEIREKTAANKTDIKSTEQAQQAVKDLENLKKIAEKLPDAQNEACQLSDQIRMWQKVGLKK